MSATTSTLSSPEYLRGSVKWFNARIGYGFITVIGGNYSGKDIFVHYLGIVAPEVQYKYLVQDEVVEFALTLSTGSTHEFNATEVHGVDGIALTCETLKNQPPPLPLLKTHLRAPVKESISGKPSAIPTRKPRVPSLSLPKSNATPVDPFLLALKMEKTRLKEYIRGVKANSHLPVQLSYRLIQSVFNNQAEILKEIENWEQAIDYKISIGSDSALVASLIDK